MFGHSLNPHYFENPPALTYMLHCILAIWPGGGDRGVLREYELHPTTVYVVARGFVALTGVLSVWLLYLTGTRLFSRGVGLLAAAVMAVAFLPVFYSHLALNDVPALAPFTLSLFGAAGILTRGGRIDYLVAGFGVGLASATKYTGGIVLLAIIAACIVRYVSRGDGLQGAVFAGMAALVTFVAADPYFVLAFSESYAGIVHQATLSSEAQGKLGAPRGGGIAYYLWSLTWGLGWLPSIAAAGGAVAIWRKDRNVAWILVPTGIAFLAIMGTQTRYFGRWIMPLMPIACLLGAFFALQLAKWMARLLAARGLAQMAPAVVGVVTLGMCGQGLIYSVHSGLVLSRPFTATLARKWMIGHVPTGAHVVVEPVVPNAWLKYFPGSGPRAGDRDRWIKLPALVRAVAPNGRVLPYGGTRVSIEDYERTLTPALIPYYESGDYCWVLTGTTQSGRAYADRAAVPEAVAYYRALASQAEVAYRVSPYAPGTRSCNVQLRLVLRLLSARIPSARS